MRPTLELQTPSGDFQALDQGDRGGPLVLCLHGFPDFPPNLEPVAARLAAMGNRAVSPWMRGYAPSVLGGPYHPGQLARDVLALAEALSPDRPVRLLGHDWGAVATYAACSLAPGRVAAAVTLAVPHPLAFLSALPMDPAQLRRSWYMGFFQARGLAEHVVARDDFALVDRLWRRWSPGYVLPATRREALHRCLAASLPAPLRYYRALLWPPRQALVTLRGPASRAIAVPTLHLHGAEDGCIAADVGRDEARWFRGPFAREVLPGAGHFLALEAPDAVAERAVAWFRRA